MKLSDTLRSKEGDLNLLLDDFVDVDDLLFLNRHLLDDLTAPCALSGPLAASTTRGATMHAFPPAFRAPRALTESTIGSLSLARGKVGDAEGGSGGDLDHLHFLHRHLLHHLPDPLHFQHSIPERMQALRGLQIRALR